MLDEVAGRGVVQHRRAVGHRLLRIEHRRQVLVLDLDRLERPARRQQVLGGHRGHRLADIAHLAARHDRLVVDEHAKPVLARNVVAGDDAFHALHGLGLGGVDRHDAGVRPRAAQHLDVEHVRHDHVAGIAQLARHLRRRIDAAHVGADEGLRPHLFRRQRRGRQRAVHHVARQFHRLEDLLVAGAAADVAAEPLLDLLVAHEGVGADGAGRRHHHARDAIAALAGAGLVEGLLENAHLAGPGQVLHRLDGRALHLGGRHEARLHQHAVDEHRARAALARPAAFLGAGQVQVVAQEIQQPQVGLRGAPHLAAVDGQFNLEIGHRSSLMESRAPEISQPASNTASVRPRAMKPRTTSRR